MDTLLSIIALIVSLCTLGGVVYSVTRAFVELKAMVTSFNASINNLAATIDLQLTSIKEDFTGLKQEYVTMNSTLNDIMVRQLRELSNELAVTGEVAKSAHKRLDCLEIQRPRG